MSIRSRTARYVLLLALGVPASSAPQVAELPTGPLVFGGFTAVLRADGTFELRGGPNAPGWPEFKGSWKASASEITLQTSGGPPDCAAPGRYGIRVANRRVTFDAVDDPCVDRRMIMDRSTWRPAGEVDPIPERRLVVTRPEGRVALPRASSSQGSWPSFRGAQAAGIALAKKRGVYKGRKKGTTKLDPEEISRLRETLKPRQIAKLMEVAPKTVYNTLKRATKRLTEGETAE